MTDYSIISVNMNNMEDHGFFCVKNKKHAGYLAKSAWLMDRFSEGMQIKLLLSPERKQVGFLEYIPSEYTWRVVHAPDYLVIHCIWVNSKKFDYTGMASILLQDCIQNAKASNKAGVAVVTSDGTWMADRRVFMKNGFEHVDDSPPHFQLLARSFKGENFPEFPNNWRERLNAFQNLTLMYTDQCPFIGKAIAELPPVAEQHGIQLDIHKFNNAAEAREQMPSPYGVFCLGYQKQLLADHPISATRFSNILQKELHLRPITK